MFGINHFGLFAFTVLMMNLTPGTTFLTVSSNAVHKGIKAGLITAFGAMCGLLFYALLSWAGLSTFILRSPVLFRIISVAGILYLLYCSYRAFTKKPVHNDKGLKHRAAASFKDGLLVNLLNPFSIFFFLTVLPGFVNMDEGNTSQQVLFLGCWVAFSAWVVNSVYAFIFGSLGRYVSGKNNFLNYSGIITGILFLFLALRFAKNLFYQW